MSGLGMISPFAIFSRRIGQWSVSFQLFPSLVFTNSTLYLLNRLVDCQKTNTCLKSTDQFYYVKYLKTFDPASVSPPNFDRKDPPRYMAVVISGVRNSRFSNPVEESGPAPNLP